MQSQERESSPEEGELLEDGEIQDPEQVPLPVTNNKSVLDKGAKSHGHQNRANTPENKSNGVRKSVHTLPITAPHSKISQRHGASRHDVEQAPSSEMDNVQASKLSRSKREAEKLSQLAQHLTIDFAKRDATKHSLDLEECLDRVLRLSHAHEKAEPDLSKSISDIFAKVFIGLQSLHIMSNTGAGKDLNGRKSAIRAVQQFDKHKKLFSPQQQKAFSKWCESKAFGDLLRGVYTQEGNQSDVSEAQTDAEHSKAAKGGTVRRSKGQAVDLASLPKPITLPPPAAKRPAAAPPAQARPHVDPPRPPPGAPPPSVPAPITLPRPDAVRPGPVPAPRVPGIPRPPQTPFPGPNSGAIPRPRPPPGAPPTLQAPPVSLQASKRPRPQGGTAAARGAPRTRNPKRSRRAIHEHLSEPEDVSSEASAPQKFQSFHLPKAPEKKKPIRPINEQDSSSTHSSDTSEDPPPDALPSQSTTSMSDISPPQDPYHSTSAKPPDKARQKLDTFKPSFLKSPSSAKDPFLDATPPAAPPSPPSALPKPSKPSTERDTAKRKPLSQEESVPGLDLEPILEVYEERANKKQKRITLESQKDMSLEEEVQFYHGFGDPAVDSVSVGTEPDEPSRSTSPQFSLTASALPPGIEADDAEIAFLYQSTNAKADSRKKQEPQLLLDLDFDAESDRLYGVQAFSNTPSPGAGAIRGATPPPPPSPPPSPPGPPPAAPREKVKSRSQTPDLQRPGSAAETVEQATPNDQPEPASGLEDVREPEGQDPSNSAVDASSKEVLEYLRNGKMCLVLDLDHTLLNSARWGEVSTKDAQKLEDIMHREERLPEEQKNLFSIDDIQMWTKLRPHCREFLRILHRKFVMWIHTNGNRQYAETVRAILDPNREFFGDRVVANAGHTTSARLVVQDLMKKLDAQGLKGLDPVTVIIDDTAAVWSEHTANLVVIERYTYFPASTRQFNLNRPSMLESDRDERADQGQLAVIQRILTQTHEEVLQRFRVAQHGGPKKEVPVRFQQYPIWDVRLVLAHRRAQVLEGCRLLFSRLWHVGLKNEDQHLWSLAIDLGASCTTETDDSVTHLVTSTTLTEKARWATQKGKKIVSPRW